MADYSITYTRKTQEIATGGRLRDVIEVGFVVDELDAEGSVRVAASGDWSGKARAAIEAEVAKLRALYGV